MYPFTVLEGISLKSPTLRRNQDVDRVILSLEAVGENLYLAYLLYTAPRIPWAVLGLQLYPTPISAKKKHLTIYLIIVKFPSSFSNKDNVDGI